MALTVFVCLERLAANRDGIDLDLFRSQYGADLSMDRRRAGLRAEKAV